MVFFATRLMAGPIIGPVPYPSQTLNTIEGYVRLLQSQESQINDFERAQLSQRAIQLADQLNRVGEEIGYGGFNYGAWHPVNGQLCLNFCRSIGQESGISPEGAQCVSGENVVPSALGVIPFSYGCWPGNCPAQNFSNAVSVGRNCYKPGQKQDNDRTDVTVGCFCR